MNTDFINKIDAAVNAHAHWVRHLKVSIESGKIDFDPVVVQQDNVCNFSKFLYGEFAKAYKTKPIHEEMLKTHAEFHAEASRVLSLALKGLKTEALKALDSGSKFKAASVNIVMKLSGLKVKPA